LPALALAVALASGAGCGSKDGDTDEAPATAGPGKPSGEVVGEVATVLGPVEGGGTGLTVVHAAGHPCGDAAPADKCKWAAAGPGDELGVGSELRTDDVTRARLTMADGSTLSLDTGTEVRIEAPRAFRVRKGAVFADVSEAGGEAGRPEAHFTGEGGEAVVKGTRLLFAVKAAVARVAVARGEVELRTKRGSARVAAGMEGTGERDQMPHVGPARSLAYVIDWARALEAPAGGDATADKTAPVDLAAGAAASPPARGMGTLRARVPGSAAGDAKSERPLRLARHEVKVTVRGAVARTEVVEEFANPTPAVLEGTYEFPLPPEATITRLALWVGDRLEEGEIVENARAEKIFKSIVEDTIHPRDPALLRWKEGSTFSMKVFPIPGNGARKVLVEYTEVLAARFGRYRYVHPLARASGGGGEPVDELHVDVDLDAGAPLAEVATPRWPAGLKRSATGATASFSAKAFAPPADFALEWALADAAPPATGAGAGAGDDASARAGATAAAAGETTVATYLAKDGHRYFLARVRPDLPDHMPVERRDYVFIVDTSWGVAKDALRAETGTVLAFLAEMDTHDRFKVLACDYACRAYADDFRNPSLKELGTVQAFLEAQVPAGSSDLDGAFRTAAAAAAGSAAPRLVYLGDGVATSGALRPDILAMRVGTHLAALPGARVDVVGVGVDVDRLVLEEIARRFDGLARYVVTAGDEVRAALEIVTAQYTATLGVPSVGVMPAPGLTVAAADVFPARLPNVQDGDEVLVVGRFEGEGTAELALSGRMGGEPWTKKWPLALHAAATPATAYIPSLWGRAKVDALTLADPVANKDAIVKTSFETSVMSRFTSFLVLENERMYEEFKVERKKDRDVWTGTEPSTTPTGGATGLPAGTAGEPAAATAPPPGLGPIRATDMGTKGAGSGAGEAVDKDKAGFIGASKSSAPGAASAGDDTTASGLSDAPGHAAGRSHGGAPAAEKSAAAEAEDHETGGADEGERDAPPAPKTGAGAAGASASAAAPVAAPRASMPAPMPAPKPAMDAKAKAMDEARPYDGDVGGLGISGTGGGGGGTGVGYGAGVGTIGGLGRCYGCGTYGSRTLKLATIGGAPAHAGIAADDAAVAGLRAKVAADPAARAPREALVKKLVKLGRWANARTEAEAWLALDGDAAAPLEWAGDTALLAGDVTQALRRYDSLAEVSAPGAKLHERLAKMHAAKGDASAACAHRRAVLELAGDAARTAAAALELARCERALGREADAVAAAEAGLALVPGAKAAAVGARRDRGASSLDGLMLTGGLGDPAGLGKAMSLGSMDMVFAGYRPVPAPVTPAWRKTEAELHKFLAEKPPAAGAVMPARPAPTGGLAPTATPLSGGARLAPAGTAPAAAPMPGGAGGVVAPAASEVSAGARAMPMRPPLWPPPPPPPPLSLLVPAKGAKAGGELVAEARWDRAVDLDLALVPPRGDRLSALKPVRGVDVVHDARLGTDAVAETLAARELGTGTYVLVLGSTTGPLAEPVSGTITVTARGTKKTLPFTIAAGATGAEVASVAARTEYYAMPRPDAHPVSKVVVGTPVVDTGLDKTIVLRVLRARSATFRYCYEKSLIAAPGLGMVRLMLELIVTPAGTVATATAVGAAGDLTSCVVMQARRLVFPVPEGGASVKVRVPLMLSMGY
jgi:Ca-activated chloride channel family protein